ncbi:MAG TPA: tRNA lysidine(34) synthetase TilS, partial [Ktedonobacteraceae bacterium]
MLERVIACIDRYQLLPDEGKVVVGVSGGADSLCLLHLLQGLCGPGKRYPGVQLQAAHLNHMLRGPESEHDARTVAHTMETWGIPCTSGQSDVLALARREKRSLEDAARVARYRFLHAVASGARIAVAHHADDQVETLLLHWLRGSSLSGQAGMSPRQGEIIRPLLEITRAEILAYCRDHALTPLEDQSNRDPRFLRNRVRHELLPLLQELNPAIRRTLLRNAQIARVDLAWLDMQVSASWSRVVLRENAERITLDPQALSALPLSLQHHLLRRVTARLCAGQSPLQSRHLQLFARLLQTEHSGGQARSLHLPGRLCAVLQTRSLYIERQTPSRVGNPVSPGGQIHLPIPGAAILPGTFWMARVEPLPEIVIDSLRDALRQEHWPLVWQRLGPLDRFTVYIDGATVGEQVLVRTWQPGDRIMPLGMNSSKKLQDIFVDRHIPRSERPTLPLFFSQAHCLWVAGLCLDHRVRLTGSTQRILRLSLLPMDDPCDI